MFMKLLINIRKNTKHGRKLHNSCIGKKKMKNKGAVNGEIGHNWRLEREKMNESIKTEHIALQYKNKKKAAIFFCGILGLNKEREFIVPADMADSIFSVGRNLDVVTYSNENIRFEVFFTEEKPKILYEHICLNVENKEEIINLCRKYGAEVKDIKREGKTLLFIRDFSGYLYEIKGISRKV